MKQLLTKISNQDLRGYTWLLIFIPSFLYFFLTRTIYSTTQSSIFTSNYEIASSIVESSYFSSSSSLSNGNNNGGASGGGSSRSSEEGKEKLSQIFYIKDKKEPVGPSGAIKLAKPLEIILPSSSSSSSSASSFHSIQSTTWVHDEELGRGYLLLSDAGLSGRIWRWEVGGGPITIGKTLHMENSGCRSFIWNHCSSNSHYSPPTKEVEEEEERHGSGGIVTEIIKGAENSHLGKLIVAEWGERRIVRIEEDGSRTPIVITVPSPCSSTSSSGSFSKEQRNKSRLSTPNNLLYTPWGNLLFSDSLSCVSDGEETTKGAVYRVQEAVNIPPLPVAQSREAHSWNDTTSSCMKENENKGEQQQHPREPELLYNEMKEVYGVVLSHDLNYLFVSGLMEETKEGEEGVRAVVVKVPINDDDDDEEEEGSSDDDEDESSDDEKDKAELEKSTINDSNPTQTTTTTTTNENTTSSFPTGLLDAKSKLFYDLTPHIAPSCLIHHHHSYQKTFGAMAVDKSSNLYITFADGVLILDSNTGDHVGTIPTVVEQEYRKQPCDFGRKKRNRDDVPTSIGFGQDGYLYVTTEQRVMRVKVRVEGVELPTDLVVPPRK